MNFLYPLFLYGLFALSIPVVIHLFHFRRFKKVYFSNISFLQSLKTEKQSKNKLRNLLVLFLRLLIITCLVLAFAQPFIPSKVQMISGSQNYVCIYIDNSPSMSNQDGKISLLESAKMMGIKILNSYPDQDKFLVLTNNSVPSQLRFYNKNRAIEIVNKIEISAHVVIQNSVIERINLQFASETVPGKIAFILSDFQRSSSDPENWPADSSIRYFAIPVLPGNTNNIAIDSVWLDKPITKLNQDAVLSVKLTNYADKEVDELVVRVMINGKQKGLGNVSLQPAQGNTLQIPFKIQDFGWNRLEAQITDYPLTFDDNYFYSYFVEQSCPVLEIYSARPNTFIGAAFRTDNYFNFNEVSAGQIDYSSLQSYRLILIDQPVEFSSGMLSAFYDYVSSGGSLLLIPSADSSIALENYSKFFEQFDLNPFITVKHHKQNIRSLNLSDPFFDNVFSEIPKNVSLPFVNAYYNQGIKQSINESSLIPINESDALLSRADFRKGHVFILHTPLDKAWTNFQNHALFVPVLYKLALSDINSFQNAYFLDKSKLIDIPSKNLSVQASCLLSINGNEFIPKQRLLPEHIYIYPDKNFNSPGFYTVVDQGNKQPPVVAMNINRVESDAAVYGREELAANFNSKNIELINSTPDKIGNELQVIQHGRPLWYYFILAALVCLFFEILLLRFWK